jgi:hypothetical protein
MPRSFEKHGQLVPLGHDHTSRYFPTIDIPVVNAINTTISRRRFQGGITSRPLCISAIEMGQDRHWA